MMLAARYRLEERLAVGGMGTVHAAIDERLGRRVAVKILKAEFASDQAFVERFRREAHAAASLEHPNIAHVYDYGRDGDQHYIVMELVDGTDVRSLLRQRGRLSPPEAANIATQVCAALAAAHAAGIVHRDIKPSNVIVTGDGDVKVTDFGVARTRGDVPLTQTGNVVGTAQYLAPEQARGEPATPASDLYSLGIVLYQMLTGSAPYTGESPVAIALRHIHETVPAPSLAVPGLPPALDAVVARATDKDPLQRFGHADHFADALRDALHSAPATMVLPAAAPAAPAEPAVPPSPGRGRPLPWIVAGLAAMTAIAALLALALQIGQAPGPVAGPSPGSSGPTATPSAATATGPSVPRRAAGPTVPDGLVGQDAKAVEETLKAGGYDVKKVEADSAEPEDAVLATFPQPGATLLPGQPVVVIASRGKVHGAASGEGSGAVVPTGLVGADAREVEQALKRGGVKVTKVSVDSRHAKDTVLYTYPGPGTPIGRNLILVVASGDPPR